MSMKCDYVLLRYCPDFENSIGPRVGIVYHHLSAGLTSQLQVKMSPDWQRDIPTEDVDYIQNVFKDVETLVEADRAEALEELNGLSAGILRAEHRGTCNEDELSALLVSDELWPEGR